VHSVGIPKIRQQVKGRAEQEHQHNFPPRDIGLFSPHKPEWQENEEGKEGRGEEGVSVAAVVEQISEFIAEPESSGQYIEIGQVIADSRGDPDWNPRLFSVHGECLTSRDSD
jgi:hypothetical protein